MGLSRRGLAAGSIVVWLLAANAQAQDAIEGARAESTPPETIDLTVPVPEGELEETIEYERCTREAEAARIAGEIIVCRKPKTDTAEFWDKEDFERRYADATKFEGDPPTPPVNVTNLLPIVGVTMTVRGCYIPPCPTPMPDLIDIEGLPEAPPGSDADRIGRGLAPRGRDMASGQVDAGELGLPPAPEFKQALVPVSPAESEEPEEER